MPREDSEFCRRNEIFLIYNVWRNLCNLTFLRNMYSFVCLVCACGFLYVFAKMKSKYFSILFNCCNFALS